MTSVRWKGGEDNSPALGVKLSQLEEEPENQNIEKTLKRESAGITVDPRTISKQQFAKQAMQECKGNTNHENKRGPAKPRGPPRGPRAAITEAAGQLRSSLTLPKWI